MRRGSPRHYCFLAGHTTSSFPVLSRKTLVFLLLIPTKGSSFTLSCRDSRFPIDLSLAEAQMQNDPVAEDSLTIPLPPADKNPVYDPTTQQLLRTPTRMVYVAPNTKRALLRRDTGGFDSEITGAKWFHGDTWIRNGRAYNDDEKPSTLHENGFQLLTDPSVDRTIDFLSKDQVLQKYYPECERLLEMFLMGQSPNVKVTVRAFDHNIRQQEVLNKENASTQSPIVLVHGDYTTTSAPRRIQLLAQPPKANDIWRDTLGETPLLDPRVADDCTVRGTRRYALINIWRSIDPDHSVQSMPLACMDATSVHAPDDLRILELRYADRVGENYLVCPAPDRHRWYYYPEMTMDEVLLIKQWDSDDSVLAKFSIHSAFTDPLTPPDAPSRRSIEVRCVAIWDSEE